jgi:hypothetical protein
MKWADYREKLGIGINDENKFIMLKNKIGVFIDGILTFENNTYYKYLMMVGEKPKYPGCDPNPGLKYSFAEAPNCKELIAKYIAFYNTFPSHPYEYFGEPFYKQKSFLLDFIKNALSDLNIQYELIEDKNGIFIFPKGAKELDDELVTVPLEWLQDYPDSHKAFINALKDYSEADDSTASQVADNLRKALECFFQEFFGGGRSLDNYKALYGEYLKKQGIPKEISGNLETILQAYSNYNNNFAKHKDSANKIVLEYILYQTGNIIRLLITLGQEEKVNA